MRDNPLPAAGGVAADEAGALARVVAVEAGRVWLEPMQTGSCGGCASAAACGAKGVGTLASRLEARRFAIAGNFSLRVGDEVEVAFGNRNLIRAAAVAYVIPLGLGLLVAGLVQSRFGSDACSLLGALGGLLGGFVAMRPVAARLEASGALQARIVGRSRQTIHFSHPGAHCDA